MVNIIQKYGQSIKVNRQQVNINVYVKVFWNHCCAEKYMDFFWHLLIFVLTFTFYVSIFLYLSVINFTFHQGFSNREKANSLKSRTQSLVKSSLVTLFHIELFYAAIYSAMLSYSRFINITNFSSHSKVKVAKLLHKK